MSEYHLTPNLRVLNKYLTNSSDIAFDKAHPNYAPQLIKVETDWEVFKNQSEVISDLKKILKEYRLTAHQDNLLYILIYCYERAWLHVTKAYEEYRSTLRARQIVDLINVLTRVESDFESTLEIKAVTKRKDTSRSVKLTDDTLKAWVVNTLLNSLKTKGYPSRLFGAPVRKLLTKHIDKEGNFDLRKLEAIRKQRLKHYHASVNEGVFVICMTVLSYLNHETECSTLNSAIKYKDEQLRFLYDVLLMLKQIQIPKESSKEDFIRALINNITNCKSRPKERY